MKPYSYPQQFTLFIGVILCVLFSSIPTSTHVTATGMAGSHKMIMANNHGMAMSDCINNVCVQGKALDDCFEHCLQATTSQAADKYASTITLLFVVIVAAIAWIFPVLKNSFVFRRRYWFRPLYLFNSVYLKE